MSGIVFEYILIFKQGVAWIWLAGYDSPDHGLKESGNICQLLPTYLDLWDESKAAVSQK